MLRWKLNPKQIDESPSKGIDCKFVKLDEQWGVKCFFDENIRNVSYRVQKSAAEHGLGPEVGEIFTFGKYFCYITEVVELLWDKAEMLKLKKINPCEYWDKYNDICDRCDSLIGELCQELSMKIDFEFTDCHIANVGIKNGEFVCIDFAEAAWE